MSYCATLLDFWTGFELLFLVIASRSYAGCHKSQQALNALHACVVFLSCAFTCVCACMTRHALHAFKQARPAECTRASSTCAVYLNILNTRASTVVPDQFCEQFFEQNINFPAEKKLLAKCEQNIEILMKIAPKASQSGDTISFFSNVLYGTCLTTGRWRRSRSSGRGLSVRIIPFIDLRRVRVCTRIDESKPLHQAKYRQNEAMPSKIQAKYR